MIHTPENRIKKSTFHIQDGATWIGVRARHSPLGGSLRSSWVERRRKEARASRAEIVAGCSDFGGFFQLFDQKELWFSNSFSLRLFSSNDLVKNCSSSACFSTVYPKSAPSSSLCASAVPASVCFALFFSFVLVSLWSFLFLLLFLGRCFQLPVPHGVADTWQKWRWGFVVVLVVCKPWSLILLRPEGKRGADQDL